MTTTTAAIYTRLSFDKDDDGLAVARQEQDCRALCAARGWTVGEVFSDNDTSAYKRVKRPGYAALMTALRAGQYNAVVVYHLDRLFRQPRELEDLLELCESGQIGYAAVSGDVDLSTPMGRTIARMTVTMANQSSADTARRQARKNVERAANGLNHGERKFGYNADGVTTNAREAAALQSCVSSLLDGASLRSQCMRLNAEGITTARGNRWSETVLSRVLVNPRYAAFADTDSGTRVHNGERHRAAWPALVSVSEHRQLVNILTGRRRKYDGPGRYLLSGLLYCSKCGAKMRMRRKHGRTSAAYACPPKPVGRNCMSVSQQGLEAYVTGEVMRVAMTEKDAPVIDDTITALADRVTMLRERLDNARRAYKDGRLEIDDWIPLKDEIRADIARYEQEIDAKATVAAATARRDRLVHRWADMNIDDRRTALKAWIARIDIRPGDSTRGRQPVDQARVGITFTDAATEEWAEELSSYPMRADVAAFMGDDHRSLERGPGD